MIREDLPRQKNVYKSYAYNEHAFCTLWDSLGHKLLADRVKGPTFVQLRQELIDQPHGDNLKHWTDMLRVRSGSVYTVHPLVKRAFTRSKLKGLQSQDTMGFMQYFHAKPDLKDKAIDLNRFERAGRAGIPLEDPIFKDLHEMQRFHVSVNSDISDAEKRDLSFRTFGFTDITDVDLLDMEILDISDELHTFAEPVKELLSCLGSSDMTNPLVQKEVNRYLALHDRLDWNWENQKNTPQTETN